MFCQLIFWMSDSFGVNKGNNNGYLTRLQCGLWLNVSGHVALPCLSLSLAFIFRFRFFGRFEEKLFAPFFVVGDA